MNITLNNNSINTYKDLMKTIQSALYTAWGKDKVTFTSAYPQNNTSHGEIKLPIITYRSRKIPGAAGTRNTEIKPRVRDILKAKNEIGEDISTKVFGQNFEYTLTFEIWAENGLIADQLTEDFERFISTYTPLFLKLGVGNIVFESRDDGQNQHQWRTDIIKRTLNYQFTLDQITSIELDNINGIEINTVVYSNVFQMLSTENIINNIDEL